MISVCSDKKKSWMTKSYYNGFNEEKKEEKPMEELCDSHNVKGREVGRGK